MVMESHLFHKLILVCDVDRVTDGTNLMNVLERLYVLITRKCINVFY